MAFNILQVETFGYVKYHFHDWDKLIMYFLFPFLGTKIIKKIHRKISRHHLDENTVNFRACEEALLDWESSRFTKKDKPLNAAAEINRKIRSKDQLEALKNRLVRLNLLNPNISLSDNVHSLH